MRAAFYDDWAALKDKLSAAALDQGVPLFGTFELTPFCNLGCKMCYMRLSKEEAAAIAQPLSCNDWLALGEAAQKSGTLFLLLTGGEAMLRPDFPEIYEGLSRMGFLIKLYTNATLVTPALQALFRRIPPASVGISIYGASPETYERVTGQKEAYKKAMQGLDFFLSLSIPVQIRTTISKLNVSDFDALCAMATEKGADFVYCSVLSAAVRGAKSDVASVRLAPEELLVLREHINRDLSPETLRHIAEDKDACAGEAFSCAAGKNSYVITWEGRMRPCLLFDRPYAEPLLCGFSAAWDAIKNAASEIKAPPGCRACKKSAYCMACLGAIQAENRHLDEPSAYHCAWGECLYNAMHPKEEKA